MKRRKWIHAVLITLVICLLPFNVVFAGRDPGGDDDCPGNSCHSGNNGHGNSSNPPNDPGVGGDHTVIRTESAMWVLPHGDTFIINGEEVNIVEDWETIEIISTRVVGNGGVVFIGIGGSSGDEDFEDFLNGDCGTGGGLGDCSYDDGGNGNGCNGNGNDNCGGGGGGPLPSGDCGGVWVIPGQVVATGAKTAPNNAVVVGQDPDSTGVNVEWRIRIEPTIVKYEQWQLIGHRHVACVEGDLDENGNGNIYDPEDEFCPHGWHSVIEHIWGCVENQQVYREGVGSLDATISLTPESRSWILTDLAAAYPSASLLKPDWTYSQYPDCTWIDDVCYWNFTANIPVEDPGKYDIKVSGVTTGTMPYAPRSFEIDVGEFDVWMIENTALTQ